MFDLINIFTTVIYLVLFFFTFKSFITKDNFDFHVSLEISFAFFLWFIIQLLKNFSISEEFLISLQVVDIYALLVSLGAVVKVRAAIDDTNNLKVAKTLNFSFIAIKSLLAFFIIYGLMTHNGSFPVIYNVSFIWYFIMVAIHLPSFREYKYIKLALILLTFRFITEVINLHTPVSHHILIATQTFTATGFVLLFISLHAIYKQSIESRKKHPD